MDVSEAARKLEEVVAHAERLGVPRHRLRQKLTALRGVPPQRKRKTCAAKHFVTGVLSVTLALAYSVGLHTHVGFSRVWLKWQQRSLYDHMCTINMPDQVAKALRPPEDCSFCRNVDSVDIRSELNRSEFEEVYAYTGKPVVVRDGTVNWTAQKVFNFKYFKDLYKDARVDYQNCQFFPYDTDFTSLSDVFSMSEERATMQGDAKPWYVGWSNCDGQAASKLRRHYQKPYFLPVNAENKNIDWIFMGSPGYGAKMHVDNVHLPSWQAQLKGKKKWTLAPPPECFYQCHRMEVVVGPGEIIVLDTNRWYHQTVIVSDEISITIGAEFD